MNSFQIHAAPLDGVTLVEASAGTGKTWTLCELYLRLLLRHLEAGETPAPPPLEVREILVVTFTRAATAELRTRLLRRLNEALSSVKTLEEAKDVPFAGWLKTKLETAPGVIDRARLIEVRKRLELARLTFDEAAVSTIHGFCQRALAEVPFSGGMPFSLALDNNRRAIVDDEVRDFWRRLDSCVSPELAAYLLAQGEGPERWSKLVELRLQKPLSELRWDEPVDDTLEAQRAKVLQQLLAEIPERVRAAQRTARVLGFDELLFNLHAALTGGDFPELASRLRTRFPVALIDEFQDTDPLQYGIFEAVYGGASASLNVRQPTGLFLVGDPKQAIYGFRNADLHTYLGARMPSPRTGAPLIARSFGLHANQRAAPRLIDGCNRLFTLNPCAFAQPGIEFVKAVPGVVNPEPMTDTSSTPRPSFLIWRVPQSSAPEDKGGWRNRERTIDFCAEHCADEIARLLAEAKSHQIPTSEGPRALAARDIAVLVLKHAQGVQIRDALWEKHGIRCVQSGKDSVFDTSEARWMRLILHALADPNEGVLRGALATPLLGFDAARLQDEAAVNLARDQFAQYRSAWETRGFAFVFRRLMHEQKIDQRLLGAADGERQLTNLRHLGELLTAAAKTVHGSRDALLHWFEMQQENEVEGAEANQLRLESDDNLVRIMTVHTAKGLEFPIVFCPFLWDKPTAFTKRALAWVEYHEDSRAVIDFRRDKTIQDCTKAWATLERAAEALRLIYVAVTRASQRCYLYAAIWCDHGNPLKTLGTPLNWLLAGAGQDPAQWFETGPEDAQAVLQHLKTLESNEDWQVEEVPVITPRTDPQASHGFTPVTRCVQRLPRPGPERTSYSALIRGASEIHIDHDEDVMTPLAAAAVEGAATQASDDFLQFPRGAAAGTCVHYFFEHLDFGVESTWPDSARNALLRNPPDASAVKSETLAAWSRALLTVARDVVDCPLPDLGPLRQVARTDRRDELAFTLPVHRLRAAPLVEVIQRAGYDSSPLTFMDISGYLRGAIDLLARRDGRYFIVDWKSNHLGERAEHYAPQGLRDEMTRHRYPLQLLLYVVATHRFLRHRVVGYDYDIHFGGAYYLFLRGMRAAWRTPDNHPPGVWHDRPAREIIEALDRALGDDRHTDSAT